MLHGISPWQVTADRSSIAERLATSEKLASEGIIKIAQVQDQLATAKAGG